jgi:hypothetical protein
MRDYSVEKFAVVEFFAQDPGTHRKIEAYR